MFKNPKLYYMNQDFLWNLIKLFGSYLKSLEIRILDHIMFNIGLGYSIASYMETISQKETYICYKVSFLLISLNGRFQQNLWQKLPKIRPYNGDYTEAKTSKPLFVKLLYDIIEDFFELYSSLFNLFILNTILFTFFYTFWSFALLLTPSVFPQPKITILKLLHRVQYFSHSVILFTPSVMSWNSFRSMYVNPLATQFFCMFIIQNDYFSFSIILFFFDFFFCFSCWLFRFDICFAFLVQNNCNLVQISELKIHNEI